MLTAARGAARGRDGRWAWRAALSLARLTALWALAWAPAAGLSGEPGKPAKPAPPAPAITTTPAPGTNPGAANPNADPTAPTAVAVSVARADGPGLPARLVVRDSQGRVVPGPNGLPFHLCPGRGSLDLRPGRYEVVADAGMRLHKERRWLRVDAARRDNAMAFSLANCAWGRRAGWLLCNPFFDNPLGPGGACRFPDLAAVQGLAASGGLDVCGASHLEFLRSSPNGEARFLDDDDGGAALARALDAPAACRLIPMWRAGDVVALEPRPLPAGAAPGKAARLAPLLAAARDRGAVTVMARPTGAPGALPGADAVLCLVAGGLFDAIDVTRGGDDYLLWQTLLRLGLRLPAVAGGGEVPNLSMYLATGRDDGAAGCLQALREGRSLVSNGPFLELQVLEPLEGGGDTAMVVAVGETMGPSASARVARVSAVACSDPADSVGRVELLYNGEVIETAQGRPDQKTMQVTWRELEFSGSGWLQARYVSTAAHLWAVSNPVYVGAAPRRFRAPAVTALKLSLRPAPARAGTAPAEVEVTAENFGAAILRRRVPVPGALSCRLPATAEIVVRAPGSPPLRRDLFALTGAAAHWEKIAAAGNPRALCQKNVLEKLRSMLEAAECELEVP